MLSMKRSNSLNQLLLVSWVTSLIAMGGSLYFSEVMHFIPCTLCWYQRILMYPLTLLLGIATYEGNGKIKKYVLPMSITGMMVSGYHYALQNLPSLQNAEMCRYGVPCSGKYIDWFGFMTIPLLAFTAFTLITVCLLLMKKK
jgi:disulfide bond formation protein DsbB